MQHRAAMHGRTEVISLLIDNGAGVYACYINPVGVALRSLTALPADLGAADEDGRTVLHYIAFHSEIDCALMLLQNNADADALDKDQKTPLFFSVSNGQREMADFLVFNGAIVTRSDRFGRTALHWAALHGYEVGTEGRW